MHKVFFGIIQNESEGGEDKEDLIATAKVVRTRKIL